MPVSTVTCPACGKVYRLPANLPQRPRIKLRCPTCRVGFAIERPAAGGAGAARVSETEPAPPEQVEERLVDSEKPPSRDERRRQQRRAKRLARAIVQDMVAGQRDRRERALESGNLLLEFGDDVRKAWIAYQEKAGAEIAQSTSYFRDALNEILADGKALF